LNEQLRIYGQQLRPETVGGLLSSGFQVDEVPAGAVDAVLLEADVGGGPDLASLAMLRLEHPDSLLLLSSPAPAPRRLIEWIRAGLDDWVDAAGGTEAIAGAVRANVQRRKVARQQRAVMSSLEDRRRRTETEERALGDRLSAAATELESEHQRLGDAHSALQNRVAQLVMLYRIGRNLSLHRNWDEALAGLLEQMKLFLGADGVALLLRSQGGERLAARAVLDLPTAQVDEAIEVLGQNKMDPALGETLFPMESLRAGRLDSCADQRKPFSQTVVPLVHRGRDLGCLIVGKDYRDGVAFADDYYFLVTIRTVVAEEVAAAQAVHELRRLQQFQERTLEQLASGIVTFDGEGKVSFANRRALELLEVSEPAEIDIDAQVRLGAESPPLRRWTAGIAEQASSTIDAWVHSGLEQEAIPVSLIVSSLPGEVPGEVQYVCVIEDRRQRQALEAERRRAARQKDLLIMAAEWAHDVRTPLTGILHRAELLAGTVGAQAGQRHFDVIQAEVQRINELVNHFLEYARPAQLKQQPEDMIKLVQSAVELMEGAAQKSGCVLELDLECARAGVGVDSGQFKQVLLNLMMNALDAAPQDSVVRVRVGTGLREEISGSGPALPGVVLEIIDTGTGVKAGDIDRLFVPFFTTRPEGTGLGLAIADKIVRAHGGTLRYERDAGCTIFRIVLPELDKSAGPDGKRQPAGRGLQARG